MFATTKDVPIYRLSRPGGVTVGDTSLASMTTIEINEQSINNFVETVNADAEKINLNNEINTQEARKRAKITSKKAEMIALVLQNGLKQFNHLYGEGFYNEEAYFLATQVLIWEIQEGRRIGWDNVHDWNTWAWTNHSDGIQLQSMGINAKNYLHIIATLK